MTMIVFGLPKEIADRLDDVLLKVNEQLQTKHIDYSSWLRGIFRDTASNGHKVYLDWVATKMINLPMGKIKKDNLVILYSDEDNVFEEEISEGDMTIKLLIGEIGKRYLLDTYRFENAVQRTFTGRTVYKTPAEFIKNVITNEVTSRLQTIDKELLEEEEKELFGEKKEVGETPKKDKKGKEAKKP